MEDFENKYQITKTIRFGLTLKNTKEKKESHLELKDLVDISQERIITENSKKSNSLTEENFVSLCKNCIKEIEKYLKSWKKVYIRLDQISITRDYYKVIAKKAGFDITITDEKKKNKPKSQLIKISSLKDFYFGKARKDYILDYWEKNIDRLENLCNEFKPILKQYEIAIKNTDKAHQKPHLVDFKKMFLSICNIVCDTLVPLVNNSIVFPYIDKLSNEERNEAVKEFSSSQQCDERRNLLRLIEEIREYFQCNGGNVLFGRVTLNKYTAEQKPNNYKEEIKKIIQNLHFYELIRTLRNEKNVSEYFQKQDKFSVLKDENKSIIERAQMFKCKPIPASVRIALSDFLQKENALSIIESIGMQISPAYDYSKITKEEDKNNFNLDNYPIKLAFDYAWENLARSQYRGDMDFPKEKCKDFLKNKFGIDSSNENFKLYAGLLFITENIATLEYGEPNDKAKIISEIEERIKEFDPNKNLAELQEAKKLKEEIEKLEKWKKKKEIQKGKKENKPLYDRFEKIKHLITMEKYFPEIEKAIKDYLNKSKTEREKIRKEKTDETYLEFLKAKQEIGLVRGEQKNKIKKYHELTQTFKDLASNFGKKFAELRDKFREENEINKISYCGIIVEDKNCDRYLLLQPINDNNNKSNCNDTQIYETKSGELTTYQVKSLTSKTLNKMIKNTGSYKEFHYCSCEENKIGEKEYKKCCGIDSKKVKEEWAAYQNEDTFISALEKALTNSIMAQSQKWAEFNWNLNCDKYDEIAKEVDIKSYILQRGKISVEKVTDLIKNNNCLLLPIVNQDITSETRKNKNQFSKDWKMIFDNTIKEYRLHPEFNIIYRKPVPDYPKPKEPNRYSRFQMIANIQCEIMPQMSQTSVKTKKEQIEKFNNKESQKKTVKNFNDKVKENIGNDFYVFGIDRGIKQLATLCILDNKGIIQGNFEIYKREFDKYKKQWIHSQIRTDNILDLSNIRVETTIEGKKVLVDLSKILVHDKNNPGENKKNQQTIKLKQLAYIRKLQYQMQYNSEKVKNFINSFEMTKNESGRNEFKNFETNIIKEIKKFELISPYKQGTNYSDLPIEKFKQMLENFKYYDDNKLDKEKQKLCELDVADKLKSGIVANMVGVIVYLLELDKYRNKTYISLENLNRANYFSKDGITGQTIPSTYQDPEVDFKQQENLVLAGVGTYQFFEIQLLKKLFKIQRENKIVNLVPAFRSVANYEQIIERDKKKDKDEYKNYPFGVVQFVDPRNTSQKCPWCGCVKRKVFNRGITNKDFIECKQCNFSTIENNKHDSKNKQNKEGLYLHFIENGDQNAAYHIALKTLKNIKKQNK